MANTNDKIPAVLAVVFVDCNRRWEHHNTQTRRQLSNTELQTPKGSNRRIPKETCCTVSEKNRFERFARNKLTVHKLERLDPLLHRVLKFLSEQMERKRKKVIWEEVNWKNKVSVLGTRRTTPKTEENLEITRNSSKSSFRQTIVQRLAWNPKLVCSNMKQSRIEYSSNIKSESWNNASIVNSLKSVTTFVAGRLGCEISSVRSSLEDASFCVSSSGCPWFSCCFSISSPSGGKFSNSPSLFLCFVRFFFFLWFFLSKSGSSASIKRGVCVVTQTSMQIGWLVIQQKAILCNFFHSLSAVTTWRETENLWRHVLLFVLLVFFLHGWNICF